jgi:hypothetical protein
MEVKIMSGYGGKVTITAEIDGEQVGEVFIIENEEVVDLIKTRLLQKDYKITKTNQQKYARINFN